MTQLRRVVLPRFVAQSAVLLSATLATLLLTFACRIWPPAALPAWQAVRIGLAIPGVILVTDRFPVWLALLRDTLAPRIEQESGAMLVHRFVRVRPLFGGRTQYWLRVGNGEYRVTGEDFRRFAIGERVDISVLRHSKIVLRLERTEDPGTGPLVDPG